jgi:dephospho-CoA kinase
MITVGCTGGIGSGKSSVVALLAEQGAVAIRADDLARRVVEPGTPGLRSVVERFGPAVLARDGRLDRAALAARIFADAGERAALEAIVHPLVHDAITADLQARRDSDDVVVLELPLLAERGGRARYGLDGVLVVDAPLDIVLDRLTRERQMDEAEARLRIAAQASSAERLRMADFVIVNVGTRDELALMVGEAWRWIEGLAAATA